MALDDDGRAERRAEVEKAGEEEVGMAGAELDGALERTFTGDVPKPDVPGSALRRQRGTIPSPAFRAIAGDRHCDGSGETIPSPAFRAIAGDRHCDGSGETIPSPAFRAIAGDRRCDGSGETIPSPAFRAIAGDRHCVERSRQKKKKRRNDLVAPPSDKDAAAASRPTRTRAARWPGTGRTTTGAQSTTPKSR